MAESLCMCVLFSIKEVYHSLEPVRPKFSFWNFFWCLKKAYIAIKKNGKRFVDCFWLHFSLMQLYIYRLGGPFFTKLSQNFCPDPWITKYTYKTDNPGIWIFNNVFLTQLVMPKVWILTHFYQGFGGPLNPSP